MPNITRLGFDPITGRLGNGYSSFPSYQWKVPCRNVLQLSYLVLGNFDMQYVILSSKLAASHLKKSFLGTSLRNIIIVSLPQGENIYGVTRRLSRRLAEARCSTTISICVFINLFFSVFIDHLKSCPHYAINIRTQLSEAGYLWLYILSSLCTTPSAVATPNTSGTTSSKEKGKQNGE